VPIFQEGVFRTYDHLVTDSVDDEQREDEPLLDWEAARFVFWPLLTLGVASAVCAVAVEDLRTFAILSLISFQAAWRALRSSGRLKKWKSAKRIVSGVLWVAWIVVLGAYGRAHGWF
jgi:hypothetical protein